MTATKEEFKHDMHKDPAELEREADRARANVESTLEALERRLSPGELLDQVLHVVKDNGGAFGKNLATQVRNNPVPVLLTGIGMTWLMAASDRPPRRYAGYGYETGYGYGTGAGHDAGARVEGAMESAQGAGSSAMESARGAASSATHSARDAASRAGDSARSAAEGARARAESTARGVADTTRASAEGLWDTYEYMRREQPLALGALAVAAGALLGSMLPSTTTEDRMMGEQSDEAAERLKEQGRRGAEQARAAAADAAETARESVQPKRAGRAEPPSGSGSATRS
ncbi:MAG: DUF3618 domain-containing protein [Pseudomonadales bacterium]